MNLVYDIKDKPKRISEWILYTLQMVLAVFVATVLIANICGTPVGACLVGAGVGTLIYQLITGFKSPMFISSCGATVSAVIGALALGEGQNYRAVLVGGGIIFLVYAIFAIIATIGSVGVIQKLFPPVIIGPITMVIGLNLAGFLPTYIGNSNKAMVIALITMFVTAVIAHYCKGFFKTIAFLIGLVVGYLAALAMGMIEFETVDSFFSLPDFSFLHWKDNAFDVKQLKDIVLLFVPVSICSILEHLADHQTLSNIIGHDLIKEPGLYRTLLGDGLASFAGTAICGLPNTSYGESVATIGFSKVASVCISTCSALTLICLAFITPVRMVINSIPACVFGGSAMILYGYITSSGLKVLLNSKADLEDTKNLIITSVILTIGVSGIYFFSNSFAGASLAMVVGVLLNLILKDKTKICNKNKKDI